MTSSIMIVVVETLWYTQKLTNSMLVVYACLENTSIVSLTSHRLEEVDLSFESDFLSVFKQDSFDNSTQRISNND